MTDNIPVNIIVFGQIAEITGSSFIIEAGSTDSLKNILQEKFPALSLIKFVVAVNKKVVTNNMMLAAGDTIALLPPYSGG